MSLIEIKIYNPKILSSYAGKILSIKGKGILRENRQVVP